jgi:hypothetical protein
LNTLGHPEIRREIETLDISPDREAIADAAVALAGSADPEALVAMRERLARNDFLARLDDLANPQDSVFNLSSVFAALRQHPDPLTGELCVALANEPEFVAEPARLNYLLPALAAVRPMSEAAANLFRRTNHEGFYGVNAPLLAENGTPHALTVFQEMIETPLKDAANKVYVLHHSLVPRRTDLPLLETCAQLIGSGLERAVEMGVIESIFDYQERPWYGNIRRPPRPPSWESAPSETLRFALDAGKRIETRTDLRAGLNLAIANTVSVISRILAARAE